MRTGTTPWCDDTLGQTAASSRDGKRGAAEQRPSKDPIPYYRGADSAALSSFFRLRSTFIRVSHFPSLVS